MAPSLEDVQYSKRAVFLHTRSSLRAWPRDHFSVRSTSIPISLSQGPSRGGIIALCQPRGSAWMGVSGTNPDRNPVCPSLTGPRTSTPCAMSADGIRRAGPSDQLPTRNLSGDLRFERNYPRPVSPEYPRQLHDSGGFDNCRLSVCVDADDGANRNPTGSDLYLIAWFHGISSSYYA